MSSSTGGTSRTQLDGGSTRGARIADVSPPGDDARRIALPVIISHIRRPTP